MFKWSLFLIMSCLISFVSTLGFAKELRGITFPDTTTLDGQTLKLNGLGVRKAYEMFDVYVAALYVDQISNDTNVIINQKKPKQLVMHFKRFVEKSKITDAWKDGFHKNSNKGYNYSEDLNKLTQAMIHMKENDRITINFYSDKADVKIGEKTPITIMSSEFSQTMLKVFIGVPPDERLKKGLLGL